MKRTINFSDVRLCDIDNNKHLNFICDGDNNVIYVTENDYEIYVRKLTKEEEKELRKLFPRRKKIGSRKA